MLNKAILVAALLLAMTSGVYAQASRRLEITEVPDFSGFWQIAPVGRDFDQRVACGSLKDSSGNPMTRCSLPWEAKGGAKEGLKDVLNKRGLAWMEFRDEHLSEKHMCIPNTLPAIQDRYIGNVFQIGAGELHIESPTDAFTEGVRRVVWMDGRKHPGPHELFLQGHSIGWYEGDELVIETTNFTFNPDGIEDHTHVPSSAAKIVTERWKRLSATRMDVTYTIEDKLFLKKPFTFVWRYEKTAPPLQRNQVNFVCDPDVAWNELQIAAPSKYNEQ